MAVDHRGHGPAVSAWAASWENRAQQVPLAALLAEQFTVSNTTAVATARADAGRRRRSAPSTVLPATALSEEEVAEI
jgi:hypothetical protein